jgi:cytochrome c oxidase subunit 3
MSAQAPTAEVAHARLDDNFKRRLSLWLFFVTEAMMFGAFALVRFQLWGPGRVVHLDQILGLNLTVVLLLSSATMAHGEHLIGQGDKRGAARYIGLTILFGVLFLAGLAFEWATAPFRPWDGVFGAVFYGMTGMHGLHVLGGVVFLIIVLQRSLAGRYSAQAHWGVEACALYWHFVDVVWIFFYMVLYLL